MRPSCASSPDAFLPAPAPTVRAFVEQVRSNDAARRGYAHLFHLAPEQVAGYLGARAKAGRLERGGRYTQYRVHMGGTVYPAVVSLASGSRVFLLPNGFVVARDTGCPARPYRPVLEARPALPPVTVLLPPRQTIVPLKVRQIVVPTAAAPTAVYTAPPPAP